MTDDLEVTGPVTLELWVKSSAVDTDFTAKLVDVSPEGFAKDLADGILRMRYRDSQEKADADESRSNLQSHGRPVGHEQRLQEGTHAAAGSFE